VFGDDAEHTNQPFLRLNSQTSQHHFLHKPDINFSQLQHLDSVAPAKIQRRASRCQILVATGL
jgi:hypothetical protein